MITNQQRQEKLATLAPFLADLYGSLELARALGNVRRTYKLPDTEIDVADIIGDTILGFHQTKDLPELLQRTVGVKADVAYRIMADLTEFLGPVLEREAALITPALGSIKDLHQQFQKAGGSGASAFGYASVPQAPTTTPDPEPPLNPVAPSALPATQSTNNVTPMRTMPEDMTRVHGYGAYRQAATQPGDTSVVRAAPQDELLKDRPRLMDTPNLGG
jgi:hypothetical protein